jgi:hypothetical protein
VHQLSPPYRFKPASLYDSCFVLDPVKVLKGFLKPLKVAVHIEDIFSLSTPAHQKSKTFHRTMFGWTIEDCFQHRILTNNVVHAVKEWKAMVKQPAIRDLNIGDLILDISVPNMGMINTGYTRITIMTPREGEEDYKFDFGLDCFQGGVAGCFGGIGG